MAATGEPACPRGVCDGSGWLVDEQNDSTPCACLQDRINRAKSRRMGTGIPARFRGVSFDRNPIRDLHPMVLRDARRFIDRIDLNLDEGKGRWYQGDVGTGKTSLAMLISKSAIDAGNSVAIYSVPRLLADIKETYDGRSDGYSYAALFRRLCEVDLLHLDDLGAERRTEWVLEQLYSIVNERWQNNNSIVVTSNLCDLDELREQVGERTVSRLEEMCEVLPLWGADARQQHHDARSA